MGPSRQGRGKRRLKGAFSWCGAKGGGVSRALAPVVDSFLNEAGDDDTDSLASEEALGVSHWRNCSRPKRSASSMVGIG